MLIRSLLAAAIAAALALPAAAQSTTAPAPAAGGSWQRSSVEGCTGAWLFNGVWRVRVLSVDPSASYNDGSQVQGVGVKLQVRNGTSKTIAPDDTGFADISGHGIDLAYADENTVNAVGSGTGLSAQLTDKKLAPGAASTVTVYFPYGADKSAKPSKLLIAVDPTKNRTKTRYTTKAPSFRVHLDCGSPS
ncbi:MAG: hypothetical protein NVS3B7_00800 [Candidatus Elarobacter sp.]